jgi:hypothetical protein
LPFFFPDELVLCSYLRASCLLQSCRPTTIFYPNPTRYSGSPLKRRISRDLQLETSHCRISLLATNPINVSGFPLLRIAPATKSTQSVPLSLHQHSYILLLLVSTSQRGHTANENMSAEPVIFTCDVERMLHATCVRGVDKSGPASAAPLQEKTLDYRILVEPPLLSATITDLCNEPLFFNGYLSEEEPMSSDDSSLSSMSISTVADEFVDEFETNFPELLAEDCTFVEQFQCNQAEVVTLVSPGKAKMVRVSRVNMSASSSSPIIIRPTTSSSLKPNGSTSRLSIISIRSHSHDGSVASLKVVSPKMPSTPELEIGSQTPTSSHGPATPDSPASAYFDALTSPTYVMPCPPKHRMSRNGYHLKLPSMGSKRPGSSQSMMATPVSAPMTPPSPFFKPKMTARAAAERMVPRGASERMASLDLPPYPRDFIQQPPQSRWTIRKDSFSSISSKDMPRFRLKRAESGLLPTWK